MTASWPPGWRGTSTRTEWRDLPWAAVTFVALGVAIRVRGKWEHSAPQVWPPADTSRQLGQAVREVLPGARVRRLLRGRYLLTWTRPPAPSQQLTA